MRSLMSDDQKKSSVSAPVSLSPEPSLPPGLYAVGIISEIGITKKGGQRLFLSLGRDTISILTERLATVGEKISCRVNSFDAGQLFSESL